MVPESWHHTQIMAPGAPVASMLRERRLDAGLTQAELAGRAGVSRQLVAAVEAGQNMPAVDAALGLARALCTTVEELFPADRGSVLPALGDRLGEGAPLRVGRVGDQLVAAGLPEHGTSGTGWGLADGTIEQGALRLFPDSAPAGLVLAGCDPALAIAEGALHGLGPSRLLALPASTGVALKALARGRLHAAVVHGPERALPEPPLPVLRLHLARWQVGLAMPPEWYGRPGEEVLEALVSGEVTVVQRDPAAASQQALLRALSPAGVSLPAGPLASGHIDAARAAATLGCAGVTIQAAARAFGLSFHPLEEHTVEIWLDQRWSGMPAFAALGNLLASRGFADRVAQFEGYDLRDCGTRVGA